MLPGSREGSSRRSEEDAFDGMSSGGGDELGGLILEGLQGVEVEASPDLGLPAAVVAFDGGLEARLARRCEDRSDLQGEADPADAPEVVGVVMGALESGVVVELSVTGQTELAPVFEQGRHADPRGDRGSGPGSRQAAVKRDGVKDLHIDSAFNDKAFDDVEAIDLNLFGSDLWQVPAAGRSRTAHPSVAVQSSSPFQDSTNRANRRDPAGYLSAQLSVDGDVAVLSQVAGLPKLLAQPQDFLFDVCRDTVGGLTGRSGGAVGPVDAVQAFSFGAAKPAVYRRVAKPKGLGDRPQRTTSANSRNEFPTKPLDRVFLRSWPLLSGYRADHDPRVQQNALAIAGKGTALWKLTGCGKPPSTSPVHTPWKTLCVSHNSHRPNCYDVLERKTQQPRSTDPRLLTVE